MKKKIRMGIIGCGSVSVNHIRGTMESPDMEVGAICDSVPGNLEEKAECFGIPKEVCFSDYIAMIDSGKIDAVSICSPNHLHYQMTLDVIQRGLPYALEKPVCNSEAEAKALLEETDKKGIPNMVCFSYRFKAAARYARYLIQSGQLGTIYHINVEYLQGWGLPDAVNGKPIPLNWHFTKEKCGTGVLGDLGCHMIDMCRFLTGREFTRVSADLDTFIHERPLPDSDVKGVVDIDDYVNIIGQLGPFAEMRSGEGSPPVSPVAVNLAITRFAYSRDNYQRVEVYGEKGAIRYSLDGEDRLEVNMGNWPMRRGRVWCNVPIPGEYNSEQMQSFADIVNGCGDGLAAGIRDGWKAQLIVDSALASSESGMRKNII